MRLLIRYAVLAGLIAMCAGAISMDMHTDQPAHVPGTANRLMAGMGR